MTQAAPWPTDGALCTERERDARLAARIAAGDDLALGALYDRYGRLVYCLARRVTGSASGAEDVTQDAFASLWEQIERFDTGRGSLKAYVCTIAYRRAVDWVRREVSSARRAQAGAARAADIVDPPDAALAAYDLDRLRGALGDLPGEQREAVVLAYYHGLTYRQVADRLGIPEGTAKSRLRLALARLRTTMTQGGRRP
jgi:RNA polymerase sigma-70 factor (ECF subfamily)